MKLSKQIPPRACILKAKKQVNSAAGIGGNWSAGPLHYTFDIGVSSGALWVNGSLRAGGNCVVCLSGKICP